MKTLCFKLFPIVIIICLGTVIYSNTFFSSFHFDDSTSIVNNFNIRDIHNLQNVWNFLPRRVLLYLSLALNYHFSGLNVLGYHVFNLAIHLTSAVLVRWLVLLTLSTPVMKGTNIARHAGLIALFAALIFVCHPVQTQAVTYIIQRDASMACLFYLLSLTLYIKSRLPVQEGQNAPKFCYTGSLLVAIAAMFTKEICITLPLMIVLYEWMFFSAWKNINWRCLTPFLLTMLIIPVTIYLTESPKAQEARGIAAEGPTRITPVEYMLTEFRVVVTYIRLIFLPFGQNIDYDYPVYTNFLEVPVLASFLFLASILFFAARLFPNYRLLSFSIFWFFLSLIPESSILPIKDVIFEHRLYLPMVGGSIFLVGGLYYLLEKNSTRTMIIVLTVMVACFSVLTYQRNKVWKDELSLWDDALRKSPHKARPYSNRGKAYAEQGRIPEALVDLDHAIELNPGFADAYINRGDVYNGEGRFSKAVFDYNKAIKINPNYGEAYYNRGLAYVREKDLPRAMADLNRTIQLDPHLAAAYNNRGSIYLMEGKNARAIADYTKAIEINPGYAEAYYNRGLAYDRSSLPEAIANYTKAIDIDPHYAESYNNRGFAYLRQNNVQQAVADYTKAIEINPAFGEAYYNRSLAYYSQKEYDKAWKDEHKAESLGYSVNPRFLELLKQASPQG